MEKEGQIINKMLEIAELIEQSKEENSLKAQNINYYKSFNFEGKQLNWEENGVYVATVENAKDGTKTYEIYSEATNSLIATVNAQGKLEFMHGYIEGVSNRLNGKDRNLAEKIIEMLKSGEVEFRLPQELEKEDRVTTREEREHVKKEKASKLKQEDDKEDKKEKEERQNKEPEEEEEKNQIAKKKGIPAHSVLVVKENSNLYKDHPNLEPNLYFYRDRSGVVKAEYIDSNGEPQPSRFFEDSTTSLRQETVCLGDDGKPVTKEVPYQVMRTKGLNNVDKDIRDIRISINIDSYGYLEIAEARQGKNGEWLSHSIEVKGRDYNSHEVNDSTSIKSRKADPDKQTDAYEKAENTGFEEDGIQYDEMYLIEHADEFIESLVEEGYQKKDAVQIFDYMIGEEALSLEDAKEQVNKEIKDREKQSEHESEIEDEGRTPWGDAEERSRRL